jgi:hypothetical protein
LVPVLVQGRNRNPKSKTYQKSESLVLQTDLEEEETLLVARGAEAAPSWLGSREKREAERWRDGGEVEERGTAAGGSQGGGGWQLAGRKAGGGDAGRKSSRERDIEGEGGWSNEEREEEKGWRLGFK